MVPIGAWHGRGKRTGVYGAFLLACYDEDGEEFQTICKIGTGFSEVDLETLSKALEPHLIEAPRPYYKYPEGMAPDLWFDAKLVWEVKAADLSISPTHKGDGFGDPNKGIALRFPRFLEAEKIGRRWRLASESQIFTTLRRISKLSRRNEIRIFSSTSLETNTNTIINYKKNYSRLDRRRCEATAKTAAAFLDRSFYFTTFSTPPSPFAFEASTLCSASSS